VSVLLYALLCVIWGSTWLVIKIGYGGLGAFNVASLRFFLAAIALAPLVALLGARWPRGRTEWTLVSLVGVLLIAGDYGLIYWAEQFIDSGLTAVLFGTLPLLTALCAHVYLPGDRLTVRKLFGTVLALAGVVVLFADRVRIDPDHVGPMIAVVGAAACAAIVGVASKRHGGALHAAALNAPAMFIGACVLLGVSLLAGDGFDLPRDAATWGAIVYLAIAGTVVTFLIYFTLLKTWSVTTLSFISVFTPAVAILLGAIVLRERLTVPIGLGALLILGGVALALSEPTATARAPRQVDAAGQSE
jgi:drug/metabolite transporter (DMT)-like permease